jgi:hypothetical protein
LDPAVPFGAIAEAQKIIAALETGELDFEHDWKRAQRLILYSVIRVLVTLILADPPSTANVGRCSRATRHVQVLNSDRAAVSTVIVGLETIIARVEIVILGRV